MKKRKQRYGGKIYYVMYFKGLLSDSTKMDEISLLILAVFDHQKTLRLDHPISYYSTQRWLKPEQKYGKTWNQKWKYLATSLTCWEGAWVWASC